MKCEELAKLCSTRLHGEQSPSNYHWKASACNLARGPGTTFVSRLVFVDCVRQLAKKRSKQKFRKRTQSRSQTSWLPSFPVPKPPPPEFKVEHTAAENSWPHSGVACLLGLNIECGGKGIGRGKNGWRGVLVIGAWLVTWKVSSNRQARVWRTKKNGRCPRRTCCVFSVPPDACGFSANAKRWPGEPKRGRRAPCRTCCTFTVQRDACGVNGIARHWPGEPTKQTATPGRACCALTVPPDARLVT